MVKLAYKDRGYVNKSNGTIEALVMFNPNTVNIEIEKDSITIADLYISDDELSFKEAQDMLKVLGIELYEDKEINTFEEFTDFLRDNQLRYEPDTNSACCGIECGSEKDHDWIGWETWKSVEKEFGVKLNILRNDNE